jgi:hypothetical protein
MNWTEDQLKEKGYYKAADGNYYFTPTRVSNPVTKHPARKELLDTNKTQKASSKRIALCITRYSTRLLDEDNLAGSKLLTDQLRYAGILPSDDPGSTKIILQQVKVKTKAEEHTKIEISDKLID